MTGLDRLATRFGAVERVELWRVMVAAGLTQHERHVVGQRLRGRSYGSIARDVGSSRQAVQTGERRGLGKLGLELSLEELVHATERAERAELLLARRGMVTAAELHGDAVPRRLRAPRWEREHEAAVAAFLARVEG